MGVKTVGLNTYTINLEDWRSPYWTSTIVHDQFAIVREYADEIWDLATDTVNEIIRVDWQPPGIYEVDPVTTQITQPTVDTVDVNDVSFDKSVLDDVELPTLGEDTEVPTDFTVTIPTFSETLELDIPPVPDVSFPPDPGDSPDVGNYEFPEDPVVTLPDVPVLDDIVVPSPPEDIDVISFDGTAPDNDLEAPGNIFAYNEDIYSSDLADAIDSRLLEEMLTNRTELSDGTITFGSGIPTSVQEAIYALLNDKLEEEILRSYDEANTYFAAKGHDLPPGALNGTILEANKEAARQRLNNANQVMAQAFDLAQKNNQFIIEAGLKREADLMGHFNEVAKRALEAAKFTQEAAILVYQAQVELFKAEMQLYQTEATVYEIKVRAQLAKLEQFKLQLEAARLRGDLNMQLVEIYRAQILANEALVKIFSTQVDSVKTKYEADSVRIQAYGAKIQAYTAKVNAATARYGAYATQMTGEQIKTQIYSEKVRAFLGQMEGAKLETGIKVEEARAIIDSNNYDIARYNAEIAGYTEQIRKLLLPLDIDVRIFDTNVKGTETNLSIDRLTADVDIETQRANIANAQIAVEVALKEAQLNIVAAENAQKLNVETMRIASAALSQLAASAMSSVHASAAMAHSTSKSRSYDETKDVPSISYSYTGSV